MRNLYIFITVGVLFACGVFIARAEESAVVINPYVIDEKAKAAEQVERIIKIKNESAQKVDLYPMVNDISMIDGKQEFINPHQLDKTTSLARWINFQRGAIQLMPGEETEVPLKIDINGSAIPGKRYAIISFPNGSNTEVAAENLKSQAVPSLLINLEIEDVSIEKAQLSGFKPLKTTFFKWPVQMELKIKNTGTVAIAPRGKISVYNRRDQFLEQIDVDFEKEKILPEEAKNYLIAWNKGSGIGKYKAKLELEYGDKISRDLSDTVYFWILPLPFVVVFISALFLFVSFLAYYLFRRTYKNIPETNIEENEKDVVINLRK